MVPRTRINGLRDVLTFDNWPMLLLGRLFDRKTGFVIYRKNGIEILVDHRGGDENGTRKCISSNMYRKYLPLFHLPKSVKVLDLGANGGGFPLMLRTEGIEISRAVCVELNPLTAIRLQLNLASNFGSSAVALNAAVCGMPVNSEILIKSSRGSTGESMFRGSFDPSVPTVSVHTTTMQALWENYFPNEVIDICKIDIEGAEYEVLTSTPDELLKKIGYLMIELHDPAKTPAFLSRLASLGFSEITIAASNKADNCMDVRAFRGAAVAASRADES